VPITPQQVQAAEATQRAAAHDASPQIRLVAGPGTGKSYSIEERVFWLLGQGIAPRAINVVSFTRASSVELRARIHAYCVGRNQHNGAGVRVSTLHSLALRMLKAANLLHYPADPLVLDSWELENVFDSEFGNANGLGKKRREEIRREHEAFWSTRALGTDGWVSEPEPNTQSTELTVRGRRSGSRRCGPSLAIPECLERG
jgi:superfamily I DNA/RNA helicase